MKKYVRPLFVDEKKFSCNFCGSKPGEHCRRKVDGRIAGQSHMSRTTQWFNEGVSDGSIRGFALNIK